MQLAAAAALLVSFALSLLPLLAWVGLGVHRRANPVALAAAAMLFVYGPLLLSVLPDGTYKPLPRRVIRGSILLMAWSAASFLSLPIWFPAERNDAVATALGVFGLSSSAAPRAIADGLPGEPELSVPQLAEAEAVVQQELPPSQRVIGENQIALPYEGEGRRMSVPVIFGASKGRELEVDMMLDTGATYTTLSTELLAKIGIRPKKSDPVIKLHTANGEREATLVLVDHIWLGDLEIEGIAIAVCDDCASADSAGLLGLNVVGGFNVSIDADRKEVVFSRRASFDRKLDIKPFIDLDATFTRFPGGRVEVVVNTANNGPRAVRKLETQIRCREEHWSVSTGAVQAGEQASTHRKLPDHEPCDEYEISLLSAQW